MTPRSWIISPIRENCRLRETDACDSRVISNLSLAALAGTAAVVIQQVLLFHTYFPKNDGSSHIPRTWMMQTHGFHALVPNWNHGFDYVSFLSYPPLYAFVSNFFAWAASSIEAGYSLTFIFAVLLGLLFFTSFGRPCGLNGKQVAFAWLAFYFNPVCVGWIFKVGRAPELLGWTFFVPIFLLATHYRNNRIDGRFHWIGVFLGLTILSQSSVGLFACLMIFSLFVSKNGRDRLQVVLTGFVGLLISSFWMIPFLANLSAGSIGEFSGLDLLDRTSTLNKALSRALPILCVSMFTLFIISRERRTRGKDLRFFFPFLVLTVVYLFRIARVLPLLNKPFPGSYHQLMMAFMIFFLLGTTRIPALKPSHLRATVSMVTILVLAFTLLNYRDMRSINSIEHHPGFVVTELFEYIDDVYFILGDRRFRLPLVGYATVYHDLSTIDSWHPPGDPPALNARREDLLRRIAERDCAASLRALSELQVGFVIAGAADASWLAVCGLSLSQRRGEYALMKVGADAIQAIEMPGAMRMN